MATSRPTTIPILENDKLLCLSPFIFNKNLNYNTSHAKLVSQWKD